MPVEIIAHRGSSRDCLENTMQSFQRALDQGADAFELDVHATRDGVVVVHHDPDVLAAHDAAVENDSDPLVGFDSDPLVGTPGGKSDTRQKAVKNDSDPLVGFDSDPLVGQAGPANRRLTINAVDYSTLRQLRLRNGESVPTLDDVLALAGPHATVYVEVKGLGIEANVIECLLRHPDTRTAVHSFDHRIPFAIGRQQTSIPIGILSASYLLDIPHMIHSANARDLWQQTALIDQSLVDAAHASGARVIAWTENSVSHAAELVQMGVDAICTDIPAVIRSGLQDTGLLTRR